MTGGLNLTLEVWQTVTRDDDAVGGFQYTGTFLGCVNAQMAEIAGEQILEQQGAEIHRQYGFLVEPRGFEFKEGDRVKLVWPPGHHYIDDFFRIKRVGYNQSVPRSRTNYLLLSCARSEEAHSEQR